MFKVVCGGFGIAHHLSGRYDLEGKMSSKIKEKYNELSFVSKCYLYSLLVMIISVMAAFSKVPIVIVIGMSATMLLFTFSLVNDITETVKPLLKYTAVKGVLVVLGSILTTFAMIETYQDVNEVIGVDPSLLSFTTSLVFMFKLLSMSTFYVGLGFIIFMILGSAFLPILLIPLGFNKDSDKKKASGWRWAARFLSLFCVYVLGMALAPERTEMKIVNFGLITKLAFYADFNSNHYCSNSDLNGRPVLFLQKGFVLAPKQENKSKFEIVECY